MGDMKLDKLVIKKIKRESAARLDVYMDGVVMSFRDVEHMQDYIARSKDDQLILDALEDILLTDPALDNPEVVVDVEYSKSKAGKK